MATIITYYGKDGGLGKTTSNVNTATTLADYIRKSQKRSKRNQVLVVELDESCKLSLRLGINPEAHFPTLSHVYTDDVPISKVIQKTDFGFDIVPGHPLLGALQDALEPGEEGLLKKHISPVLADYDFVLMDSEPGKRPLTYAALSAANYLIIPMRAQADSLKGVGQTIEFVSDVIWENFNPNLQIMGILPVMVRKVSPNSLGVVKKAREIWGDKVLPFEVPMTDLFSKEFVEGKPATILDPKHEASQAYFEVAKWIFERVERDKVEAKKLKASQ